MNKIIKLIRIHVIGIKQYQLAIKLGIATGTLCEMEAGRREISINVIKKYSLLTDIPVSKIILLSEKENPGDIFYESAKNLIINLK